MELRKLYSLFIKGGFRVLEKPSFNEKKQI
jgi:hypothetical protein